MRKNIRHKTKISVLTCSVCQNDMYVPRRAGHFRPKGHIKTMWCPYCGKKTDFTEDGTVL